MAGKAYTILVVGPSLNESNDKMSNATSPVVGRTVENVTKGVVLLIMFGFSATINGIVIHITRKRRNQTSITTLIRYLAVADMTVSLVVTPSEAMWQVSFFWYAGDGFCRALRYMEILAFLFSNYMALMIALDRCLSMRYKPTRKRTYVLILIAFFVSLVLPIPQVNVPHPFTPFLIAFCCPLQHPYSILYMYTCTSNPKCPGSQGPQWSGHIRIDLCFLVFRVESGEDSSLGGQISVRFVVFPLVRPPVASFDLCLLQQSGHVPGTLGDHGHLLRKNPLDDSTSEEKQQSWSGRRYHLFPPYTPFTFRHVSNGKSSNDSHFTTR